MQDEIRLLADSMSYEIPTNYISGRIIEYDIRSANISMLKKYNLISDDEYNYFKSIPKQFREEDIGKLIKNRGIEYYNKISEGIKDAKYQFITANNISPLSIIRIANDAIYVNSFIDYKNLKFDNYIEFVPKSIYNVMIRVSENISIYINIDKDFKVDVIGINNNNLQFHEPFLSFICELIYNIEKVSLQDAIKYYQNFYNSYINKELDLSYYREFNAESMYRHISGSYLLSHIDDIKYIDINYNLYILRNIFSILVGMFNMKK